MSHLNHVLIIADIEGSSGCWEKEAAKFLNRKWYDACVEMTKDVNAVSKALIDAGVLRVRIEADTFHKLYMDLIRICYLTPFSEKMVPVGALALYNLVGFAGLNFYNKKYRRDQ